MKISQMVFNLQSRHEHMVERYIYKVQRAITPKVGKPELLFKNSADYLIKLRFLRNFIKISDTTSNLQSGY